MSPNPEHEIKHKVLVPKLESKAVPVDNRPVAVREGPSLLCKKARLLDEDEDCDRMLERQFISSKRQRLEDGNAQIISQAIVLARNSTSYHVNCYGIGVFTLNQQRRKNSDAFSKVRS